MSLEELLDVRYKKYREIGNLQPYSEMV
jgi:hypothetical protein